MDVVASSRADSRADATLLTLRSALNSLPYFSASVCSLCRVCVIAAALCKRYTINIIYGRRRAAGSERRSEKASRREPRRRAVKWCDLLQDELAFNHRRQRSLEEWRQAHHLIEKNKLR